MSTFKKYLKIIQESENYDKKVYDKLVDIIKKATKLGQDPIDFFHRISNDLYDMGWEDEEVDQLEKACENPPQKAIEDAKKP